MMQSIDNHTNHSVTTDAEGSSPLIKVLHVVNGQHYAGAARVQDLLAMTLPEFGFEVSFACVLPDRFEAERISQQSPLFNMPMKHRLDFSPAAGIAELVRRERYALVHSHTTRSAMIASAAARLARVPYVHHVHCQMNTEVGHRIKSFVNASIERLAANTADRMIAVSDSVASFMRRQGFHGSAIRVVPNGVPAAEQLKPRRELGDSWTIGMVALLRERKGLEVLLQAFASVAREFNVRLRIVGRFESSAYEDRMKKLATDLRVSNLIDWVGFTRNVSAELTQMDALVLPSILPEGMPMVLLEAMTSGVPIIGSDVDGIRDVICHNRNGLLAAPDNPESLATQLRRLMNGKVCWNDLRTACLREYELRFSDWAMAEGVAAVYHEVLGTDFPAAAPQLTTGVTQ